MSNHTSKPTNNKKNKTEKAVWSKNFTFTWNNYQEHDDWEFTIKNYFKDNCEFGCFGVEEAPSTGTPHLQGFFVSKLKKRWSTIKNELPFVNNIEPAKKCKLANYRYCSKTGKVWVYDQYTLFEGEITKDEFNDKSDTKHSRKNTNKPLKPKLLDRYNEAVQLALDNKLDECLRKHPDIFLRFEKQLKALILLRNCKERRFLENKFGNFFHCFHLWIHGNTGSGKSYFANSFVDVFNKYWAMFCEANHYKFKEVRVFHKNKNRFWDKYQGEEIVIIEEASPETVEKSASYYKQWIDEYSFNPEIKGDQINYIRPWFIIITSNYSIKECFPKPNDYEPMERRMCEIRFTKEDRLAGKKIEWPDLNKLTFYFQTINVIKQDYQRTINDLFDSYQIQASKLVIPDVANPEHKQNYLPIKTSNPTICECEICGENQYDCNCEDPLPLCHICMGQCVCGRLYKLHYDYFFKENNILEKDYNPDENLKFGDPKGNDIIKINYHYDIKDTNYYYIYLPKSTYQTEYTKFMYAKTLFDYIKDKIATTSKTNEKSSFIDLTDPKNITTPEKHLISELSTITPIKPVKRKRLSLKGKEPEEPTSSAPSTPCPNLERQNAFLISSQELKDLPITCIQCKEKPASIQHPFCHECKSPHTYDVLKGKAACNECHELFEELTEGHCKPCTYKLQKQWNHEHPNTKNKFNIEETMIIEDSVNDIADTPTFDPLPQSDLDIIFENSKKNNDDKVPDLDDKQETFNIPQVDGGWDIDLDELKHQNKKRKIEKPDTSFVDGNNRKWASVKQKNFIEKKILECQNINKQIILLKHKLKYHPKDKTYLEQQINSKINDKNDIIKKFNLKKWNWIDDDTYKDPNQCHYCNDGIINQCNCYYTYINCLPFENMKQKLQWKMGVDDKLKFIKKWNTEIKKQYKLVLNKSNDDTLKFMAATTIVSIITKENKFIRMFKLNQFIPEEVKLNNKCMFCNINYKNVCICNVNKPLINEYIIDGVEQLKSESSDWPVSDDEPFDHYQEEDYHPEDF